MMTPDEDKIKQTIDETASNSTQDGNFDFSKSLMRITPNR